MSEHTSHNPSPDTNVQAVITVEKAVEQPNVTENPAETTNKTLLVENAAGESVQNTAGGPIQNTSSYQSSYQANQASVRRVPGRPTLKMSKEQLMAAIGDVADKLGHVPSHAELMRSGKVSGRQIVKHFGTYTRALRACNLERSTGGQKVPLEKLFLDWARVVRELKKIPSKAEFAHMGKHSDTPLKTRFGSWGQVPRYLRRYMEEQGLTEEWKDVMELIRAYEEGQDGMEMPPSPECEQKKPRVMTDRPVYGPLIRPYPMIHGPINENGVLYLFGTVSDRLGFVVTLIQGAFPDCYAMRLVDVDRWQPVRIEFEYESRNFLRHLHDPSQCDIIVCWKHNWPECPLEVIELSKIVGESGS
jgi:Homing endonuclease associated repeat